MTIAASALRLRLPLAIVHDLLVIPAAWLGALWLRFNLDAIPAPFLVQALRLLPVIVVMQGSVFLYFGLYRGVWRFTSLPDLVRILQAVMVGTVLCLSAVFFLTRMAYVPRSMVLMSAVLLVVFLSGPRLAYRWFRERRVDTAVLQTVLIVGAGRAGDTLVRALLRNPQRGYRPIGFVDDDAGKQNRDVHGVRVLGHCGQIAELAARTGADAVVIAIPSAGPLQMRRIVERCAAAGVPVRTVPRVTDGAPPGTLKDVGAEDLLGRPPVQVDWPRIRAALATRVVLVTGGAGSIGSELCRQIARLDPERLVVVDSSEFNLHRLDAELRDTFPALALSIVLADVSDETAMDRLFARGKPDVVFHAAAYKQVPLLERHVREAVRVNALGTETVARAALRHAAGHFVLISSDKAVRPASVMGASKRVAEQVCRAAQDASSSTRCLAVRFGNVIDSAGSVVPLFREQIARGGPVTVTEPNMERYFMTIPEACQLVMAAVDLGAGGELFVLDMGEPLSIVALAEQMIRLSGRIPGQDVAIEFVGARPGEKLSEEVSDPDEPLGPTRQEQILLARQRPLAAGFAARLAALRTACEACDEPAVEHLLAELVPAYGRERLQPVVAAAARPTDAARRR